MFSSWVECVCGYLFPLRICGQEPLSNWVVDLEQRWHYQRSSVGWGCGRRWRFLEERASILWIVMQGAKNMLGKRNWAPSQTAWHSLLSLLALFYVCAQLHMCVCLCMDVFIYVYLWEHLGVYMGNGLLCSFVICDLAEFLLEMQFFRRYFANNPLVYYLLSGHNMKKWL